MTAADAAAGMASPKARGALSGERTVYRAGGGRRIFFAFVFLLLLPFFLSLPAMLVQRIANNLWVDTIGLLVITIAFAVLMSLIVVELLASIRTNVDLGDTAVSLTLPAGRGPTPKFSYKKHEIPYDQIGAIETRREIYGGSLAPVMLRGARILTKDGKAIPLGYVSEANTDPAFPFPDIAKQIAERSGVPILDRGNVRRSVRRKMLGLKTLPSPDETVEEAHIEDLNQRHNKIVLALVFFLVLLVGTGVLMDLMSEWNANPPPATSGKAK